MPFITHILQMLKIFLRRLQNEKFQTIHVEKSIFHSLNVGYRLTLVQYCLEITGPRNRQIHFYGVIINQPLCDRSYSCPDRERSLRNTQPRQLWDRFGKPLRPVLGSCNYMIYNIKVTMYVQCLRNFSDTFGEVN